MFRKLTKIELFKFQKWSDAADKYREVLRLVYLPEFLFNQSNIGIVKYHTKLKIFPGICSVRTAIDRCHKSGLIFSF